MTSRYPNIISDSRWEELCNIIAEKGMKVNHKDFTISEIRLIISETVLSPNEVRGCEMHFINRMTITQCAHEIGVSESTAKYHKKNISRLLRQTACRIFK